MNTIKPLSAKDCEKLVKQYYEEIENGEIAIKVEHSWKLSDSTIFFLAENALKYPNKVGVPKIPLKVLISLASKYEQYETSLLHHPDAPKAMVQDILEKYGKGNDPRKHQTVIYHEKTPQKLLREVAKNDTPEIRQALAENPRTPGDILEGFARDPQLRQIVACNLSTPLHILKALREDSAVGNIAWEKYLLAYRKKHFFSIYLIFSYYSSCLAALQC